MLIVSLLLFVCLCVSLPLCEGHAHIIEHAHNYTIAWHSSPHSTPSACASSSSACTCHSIVAQSYVSTRPSLPSPLHGRSPYWSLVVDNSTFPLLSTGSVRVQFQLSLYDTVYASMNIFEVRNQFASDFIALSNTLFNAQFTTSDILFFFPSTPLSSSYTLIFYGDLLARTSPSAFDWYSSSRSALLVGSSVSSLLQQVREVWQLCSNGAIAPLCDTPTPIITNALTWHALVCGGVSMLVSALLGFFVFFQPSRPLRPDARKVREMQMIKIKQQLKNNNAQNFQGQMAQPNAMTGPSSPFDPMSPHGHEMGVVPPSFTLPVHGSRVSQSSTQQHHAQPNFNEEEGHDYNEAPYTSDVLNSPPPLVSPTSHSRPPALTHASTLPLNAQSPHTAKQFSHANTFYQQAPSSHLPSSYASNHNSGVLATPLSSQDSSSPGAYRSPYPALSSPPHSSHPHHASSPSYSSPSHHYAAPAVSPGAILVNSPQSPHHINTQHAAQHQFNSGYNNSYSSNNNNMINPSLNTMPSYSSPQSSSNSSSIAVHMSHYNGGGAVSPPIASSFSNPNSSSFSPPPPAAYQPYSSAFQSANTAYASPYPQPSKHVLASKMPTSHTFAHHADHHSADESSHPLASSQQPRLIHAHTQQRLNDSQPSHSHASPYPPVASAIPRHVTHAYRGADTPPPPSAPQASSSPGVANPFSHLTESTAHRGHVKRFEEFEAVT